MIPDVWRWFSPSQSVSEWFREKRKYILASVVVAVTCFCLVLGLCLMETKTTPTTIAGFIISGGSSGSRLRSAEVFNPVTGHSYPVGDLLHPRSHAPMCNNMICGGSDSHDVSRSCEMFDGSSSFTRLPVTLLKRRFDHLCWGLKTGEIILFGGKHSKKTTERISADGSSSSLNFTLPHNTRHACGIDLGDYFVVINGHPGKNAVTRYTQTGFDKDLAKLNEGRNMPALSLLMRVDELIFW